MRNYGEMKLEYLLNKSFCFLFLEILFFKTEFSYKSNGRLLDQLTYCEDNQIPICVIIGNEEIKNNSVKIRNVSTRFEVSLTLN